MPRHARIDIPGLLHHVIVRGIEKRSVFLDDQDREEFLSRLVILLTETQTDCYAWALLDTHLHLLLQPRTTKLSQFMRRLLTGYAVVFNLRHQRAGHLFQNRYKSIVCDGDSYLLELVRYIHLNPLRAGIVDTLESLDDYPWCGHRQLLGKTSRELLAEDHVLPFFSNRPKVARQRYRQFIADGIDTPQQAKLSTGGKRASLALDSSLEDAGLFDDRILGGGDFVEGILSRTGQSAVGPQRSLAEIIDQVSTYFGIERARLQKPGKERILARAKAVICYIAVRELGFRGVDVAPVLACTPGAVSHAARRGEQILRQETDLKAALGINLYFSTTSP
jgi:REP element-mobilizing transposase RayT